MHKSQQLRQSILSVLAFYDMFSYPLTPQEILAGLDSKHKSVHIGDIFHILEKDALLKDLCVKDGGYYYLKGNQALVKIRHDRYLLADKKFKKVWWFLRLLSFIPYVRLICVCNSLSYSNSHKDSDIDLFIVTKKDHAHFSRMIAGFLADLFRLRPQEDDHRDKICLSFFVDEEHMNLDNLRLGEHDVYFYYWFFHLAPIYDAGGFFDRLLAENRWARKRFPLASPKKIYQRVISHGGIAMFSKRLLEVIASGFLRGPIKERLLQYEERRFPLKIRRLKNKDTRVVINQGVLKFYPDDRRQEYAERFEQKRKEMKTQHVFQE